MFDAMFDEEINRLLRESSEGLPDGYEISICIYRGEASVSLYSPRGDGIEVNTDDMDFKRSLLHHVKVAVEHHEARP